MAKKAEIKKWKDLATKGLRGKPLESLNWKTPEGIPVKPLYTAEDLAGMDHIDTIPGLEPYGRGPRATRHHSGPGTIRAGPQSDHVCRKALDHSAICRFFHCQGVQCLLSQMSGRRAKRTIGGL